MKTISLALAFCLAFTLNLHGAAEWRDGSFWSQIPKDCRTLYITGVLDGLIAEPSVLRPTAALFRADSEKLLSIFQGLEDSMIVSRLDSFYKNPHNRRIQIAMATVIVAIQSRMQSGQQQADFAKMLEQVRKNSAQR